MEQSSPLQRRQHLRGTSDVPPHPGLIFTHGRRDSWENALTGSRPRLASRQTQQIARVERRSRGCLKIYSEPRKLEPNAGCWMLFLKMMFLCVLHKNVNCTYLFVRDWHFKRKLATMYTGPHFYIIYIFLHTQDPQWQFNHLSLVEFFAWPFQTGPVSCLFDSQRLPSRSVISGEHGQVCQRREKHVLAELLRRP